MQYLPRMAMLLWFVSIGVFVSLFVSAYVDFSGLVTVGIFPILILVLLTESFIDIQVGRSFREAVTIMSSTFLLAIFSSFVIGLDIVQRSVLLYPELIVLGVGVVNVFMGKYVGLRLVEYIKFGSSMSGGDDEE